MVKPPASYKRKKDLTGQHYVSEHKLVAEEALGKPLPPGAVVHHIDEQCDNNARNNLVICQDDFYHKILHRRMKALRESGNASARRCLYCHKWDLPEHLSIKPRWNGKRGSQAYHLVCMARYQREKKLRSVVKTD